MSCAADVHCKVPGQTLGPPFDTINKCRKCCGYFHGICGEKDPIEDDDCKRVCEERILRTKATKRQTRVTFVVVWIRRVWSRPVYICC